MVMINDVVRWCITRACNFACSYCHRRHEAPSRADGVTLTKALVDNLDCTGRRWRVKLTGGEPLIHAGIMEMCEIITENHRLWIESNLGSTRHVREFAKRIKPERVGSVRVSCHSLELERKGLTDAFVDNCLLVQEKGFSMTIVYVLHPAFIDRFRRDHEFFTSRDIRIVPKPFKGTWEGRTYPLAYDDSARRIMAEYDGITKNMRYSFFGVPCRAGMNSFTVEPDGSVFRCTREKRSIGHLGGDIRLSDEPKACLVKKSGCICLKYADLSAGQECLVQGLQACVAGKTDDGYEMFQRATDEDPRLAAAYNNMGAVAWERGDYARSVSFFKEAVERENKSSVYISNYLASLEAVGNRLELKRARRLYAHDTPKRMTLRDHLKELKKSPRPGVPSTRAAFSTVLTPSKS